MNFDRRVDPKKVFEFLSKNYDSWSQVIHEKDDKKGNGNEKGEVNSIYDYNLLDLIEETVNRHPNFFPDWTHESEENDDSGEINGHQEQINEPPTPKSDVVAERPSEAAVEKKTRNIKYPTKSFLKKNEMEYLRSRITSMMKSPPPEPTEGFNLYDTKDEAGLNTYEPDDDYDIEEVEDDYYGTEHHIEVELKPECDIHDENCDCEFDDMGEEYDFTFEYNEEGKLVPTFDGMKEYLKNSKFKNLNNFDNFNKIEDLSKMNKLKKKKKPKKKNKAPSFNPDSTDNCLFCDYEAVFGTPPTNLINYYNKKIEQEEFKRNEIKKKLQQAKLKALKKQKDLRNQQKEQTEESSQ